MYKQLVRVFLLVCLCAPEWGVSPTQAAVSILDQRAAMHPSRSGDITTALTVPRYTITGTLDPTARTWRASLTVVYTNRTGTSLRTVAFRRFANVPDMGGSTTLSAVTVDGTAVVASVSPSAFVTTVPLPKALANGAQTTIALQFVTTAPRTSADVYGTMSGDTTTLALASAFPMLALWRGTGWDTATPVATGDLVDSEAALFDMTLRFPATHRLIATGSIISQNTNAGQTTARVVTGLQRDVALALTTLSPLRQNVNGVSVIGYGASAPRATFVDAAVQSLTVFADLYGQYPYAELEVIPVNAGSFVGIEYPGVIFIQTPYYTADRDGTQLMVHEVAHQWFYGVVGNDVQRHAFVDEGWASYSEYLYAQRKNQSTWARSILTAWQAEYADLKTSGDNAVVDQPISAFTEAQYSGLVYAKAALYLHALRQNIGETAFLAAVKSYVTTYRYQRVDGNTFRGAAQRACGCDVTPLYTSWILRP